MDDEIKQVELLNMPSMCQILCGMCLVMCICWSTQYTVKSQPRPINDSLYFISSPYKQDNNWWWWWWMCRLFWLSLLACNLIAFIHTPSFPGFIALLFLPSIKRGKKSPFPAMQISMNVSIWVPGLCYYSNNNRKHYKAVQITSFSPLLSSQRASDHYRALA